MTRFADGVERRPDKAHLGYYRRAMVKHFAQQPKPMTFEARHIFNIDVDPQTEKRGDGRLRHDVFNNALKHVRMSSTPGWPFTDCPLNKDVNLLDLYEHVDRTLRLWVHCPIRPEEDMPGFSYLDPLVKFKYFHGGFTFPASLFVKGEPTDINKRARLIHGVSLVMNVIARIIFGDHLSEITSSWDTASHKVGFDFNSPQGLERFTRHYDEIISRLIPGYEFIFDDIQGWEWMDRDWMEEIWHQTHMDAAEATYFHRELQLSYMYAQFLMFVVDSDRVLHALPFWITPSGIPTTHKGNSDKRGALAEVDAKTFNLPFVTCVANGDDLGSFMEAFGGDSLVPEFHFWSSSLGFVHTDFFLADKYEARFCSQVFFRENVGDIFYRKPDSIAKLVYNLLSCEVLEDAVDILLNLARHEALPTILRLHAKVWQRKQERKLGLKKLLAQTVSHQLTL